jgi:hypothetical protein
MPTCTCTHAKLSKTSFFLGQILNLKTSFFLGRREYSVSTSVQGINVLSLLFNMFGRTLNILKANNGMVCLAFLNNMNDICRHQKEKKNSMFCCSFFIFANIKDT